MKIKGNLIHISLLGAVLLLPVMVQAQFSFTNNNGAITITGYFGTNRDVAIPDTINGLSVTTIGGYAFAFSSIVSVSIPNSVVDIQSLAFENASALGIISVPGSVTNIGDWAFANCYVMTNADIGNGVISIGSGAFDRCASLANATIGNKVTTIGDSAFAESGLANILDRKSVV